MDLFSFTKVNLHGKLYVLCSNTATYTRHLHSAISGWISQTFSKANGNVRISTGEYCMGVASNVHKQEKVTYEKQLNVIC